MLALKNKTILITRSADQVSDFINKLEDLGATTLTLPLIQNHPINQKELLDKSENKSDWIIFTSANAVRFFFETVSSDNITSKIAVVGSKTAELIKDQGLTIDFTPSEFTAKHLATEIPITNGERILIPRSSIAKNDIITVLESRGCIVDAISIYENSPISYTRGELDCVFNQNIDYITFTSGSTVVSFINCGIQLKNEKVICIGPETAKIAKEFGINIATIASPHTIEGMIQAIISLS